MSEPDYNNLNVSKHISDATATLETWIEGKSIDFLQINKYDPAGVDDFLDTVSKLSSLISTEAESMCNTHLQSEYGDELPDNIQWVRNDRTGGEKFPDLALIDTEFDPPTDWVWPGIEIKAWCPFASEMTPRLKKGQSVLQYSTPIVLLLWLPENLLYGAPKVFDTWSEDAQTLAKKRDNHWYNIDNSEGRGADSSLLIEPDFSPERSERQQHTNVDRYLWDGNESQYKEMLLKAKKFEILNEPYSTDEEFQEKLQKLISEFSYDVDSDNWEKIERMHYGPLEEFESEFKDSTIIQGDKFERWERRKSNHDYEPFREVLRGNNDRQKTLGE